MRGRDGSRPRARVGVATVAGAILLGAILLGAVACEPGVDPTGCDARVHSRRVDVSTATQLSTALAGAKAGDLIVAADGTYTGEFSLTVSGTAAQPVTVCGSRQAVLKGTSTSTGYVFLLTADHVVLAGFSATNAQKGIVLDGAHDDVLTGLLVSSVGAEGVHFRTHSSRNLLRFSTVHDTGLVSPGFGEGVYVGSANSNWCTYTGCGPDRSDANQIRDNVIGPGVAAENIDVKEGTTGGIIAGNRFDGSGLSGVNYADSWIDLKGNGWRVEGNIGTTSRLDGFQQHVAIAGWGNDNVFAGNTARVDGPGYGFTFDAKGTGNVVRCDNTVTGAAKGFANVACTA